jgi:Spy/CpxP family protein refolding chaperone
MVTKLVLCTLVLGVPGSLFAQRSNGKRAWQRTVTTPQQDAEALSALRKHLSLSDDQVTQLQELCRQFQASTQDTSEKLRADQSSLHEMIRSSGAPDEMKAGHLVSEASALRMRIEIQRQELNRKAAAVLSADQQQKLANLIAAFQTERQAMPQNMPESWPLIHAAAQLGLTPPLTHDHGGRSSAFRPATPSSQR